MEDFKIGDKIICIWQTYATRLGCIYTIKSYNMVDRTVVLEGIKTTLSINYFRLADWMDEIKCIV